MTDDFLPKQRKPTEEDSADSPEHILTQELRAAIARGETIRLAYMKAYRGRHFISLTLSLLIITIGGAAFGWFLMVNGDILRALGAMILALVPPVILIIWARMPLEDYRRHYKAVFLPELAKALGNFQFHPARGISAKILPKTGIVPAHGDYSAEDCFMGKHKGAKIILSEARLKANKNDKAYVFDGVFALVELPETKFTGHTIMTADAKLAQRMTKLPPVSLAGSGFEDVLACFSSKPEQITHLQSPTLLKEMRELIEAYENAPLSAAFFRGKYIFIAIPYKVDMFEPSKINVPITTRETAIYCQREISQILSIVDLMDVYDAHADTPQ